MKEHLEAIASALNGRHAVLFVGAGVSMSVGLPSWRTLIDHMLDDLHLDCSVMNDQDVTYQTIAECYRLDHGNIDALCTWMRENWHVSPESIRKSDLHRLIVSLDFPIIYTTNYDSNLEVAYEVHGKPHSKVSHARDMATAPAGVTQIIKYHGDFDDVETLVLTETDYFDRLSFDSPLDVRFRSDALGATVLFIGYSVSDLNIRLLLHRIWSTWRGSGYERDRPRSYVFMYKPNPVQKAVLSHWGVTVLDGEGSNPQEALLAFIRALCSEAGCRED
ncbi:MULTISPECIES: SIR2 family NAD-dependent protein deacylase [Sinorhizobium]|uniref:Sir2 family NAD-dependent protein deacetylase n=1 Tax=Sinorhizobium americanum TaxID=194963 RepID=A0A2S3YV48_9HYPH|nr:MULTISPECIES: SIR2 family protein [Sinorhizobium]PDT39579.1 Sir2 family NAD-dependent protein deacetylase [Sinorhizobium sp. FG01]POH35506.1 Sir2 family NAD-dependent protein deacetylase [Sinorhizobium americanum]